MSRVARLSNHDPSTRCRVPRPKYPHIHRASLSGRSSMMRFATAPAGTPGRSPSGATRTARRRTAMQRRARLRWRPSLRAGDGN